MMRLWGIHPALPAVWPTRLQLARFMASAATENCVLPKRGQDLARVLRHYLAASTMRAIHFARGCARSYASRSAAVLRCV